MAANQSKNKVLSAELEDLLQGRCVVAVFEDPRSRHCQENVVAFDGDDSEDMLGKQ